MRRISPHVSLFVNYHLLSFGEEVPLQARRSTSHTSFKPDKRPTTVFVFKYTRLGRPPTSFSKHISRSHPFSILDILQAMGIAPSTSKNSSNEEVIDYGDDIEIVDGPYEPSKLPLPPKDIKPRIQHLEVKRSASFFRPSTSFFSRRPNFSVYAPNWPHLRSGSPRVLSWNARSHDGSKPLWKSLI